MAPEDPSSPPSPLQHAFLSGDPAAIADRFADDAVLHSPAFSAPFRGREELTRRLFAVADSLDDVEYIGTFREGPEVIWRFRARVKDQQIEGVDIFHLDDEGRITELTVFVRPLAGLAALGELGPRFVGGHGPRGVLLRMLVAPLGLLARLSERLIARLMLGRPDR